MRIHFSSVDQARSTAHALRTWADFMENHQDKQCRGMYVDGTAKHIIIGHFFVDEDAPYCAMSAFALAMDSNLRVGRLAQDPIAIINQSVYHAGIPDMVWKAVGETVKRQCPDKCMSAPPITRDWSAIAQLNDISRIDFIEFARAARAVAYQIEEFAIADETPRSESSISLLEIVIDPGVKEESVNELYPFTEWDEQHALPDVVRHDTEDATNTETGGCTFGIPLQIRA